MTLTRRLVATLALAALCPATQAIAQPSGPSDAVEKVKQVIVYGDDPCPAGDGDEILVCARLPDNDRFRIPKELRTDPNDPKTQSWALRARSLEYVGRDGTESCSATGAGGFTGCFEKIARVAREERKTLMGDATWKNAVAAAREERMSGLDAESDEVEERVLADEAAAEAKAATVPDTPAVP